MKKLLSIILSLAFIFVLAACGNTNDTKNASAAKADTQSNEQAAADNQNDTKELTKLVVGATSVPHAEVLEQAKPILKEKGIDLQIEVYEDYILPNKDLKEGKLDANYFQHIPYLNQQNKDFGYGFVNAGGIHIEPMGIYSKNIKDLNSIPKGTEVIMSRSVADHGRVLSLLEREGLIKLKDGIDKINATVDDIVENPKELHFTSDIDAGLLPQFYKREEDSLVAINTNYAIEAGLNPSKDALILEGAESPYVNVIAVRAEDKDNPAIKTLVDVLHSDEIQNFIREKYKGAVVPVN